MNYSTGNVNIGSANAPTTKLEVSSSGTGYWNNSDAWTGQNPPTSTLTITNTTAGGYDPVLLFRQTSQGTPTTKNAGAIGFVGKSSWVESDAATQVSDMYFAVRNNSGGISERMRIRSDGSVVLKSVAGKTTETAVAFFKSDGTIVSGTSAGGSSQWSDITCGISYCCRVGVGTASFDTREDNAAVGAHSVFMPIDAYGAVFGLGLFGTPRMVFGGTNTAAKRINTAEIFVENESLTAGAESGKMRFRTKPAGGLQATAMTILSNQKVGIGIDEPDFLLTVGGDTTAASAIASINGPENQQKGLVLTSVGTTKWYIYNPASSGDLRFYNGTADKFNLSSAGNLVIGEGTYATLSGIPAGGNMELTTQGAGLIVKDETSGTRWHIHTHGDRIRAYNGSIEQVYLTTTDTAACATTATSAGSATYAANSSKLYSTDSSYQYGGGAPYYGYLTYDGSAYWCFKVSPASPAAVRVAYADSAGSAGTASTLYGQGSIQRTAGGTSYTAMVQVRETAGYGGNTDQSYAPSLGFHWGSVVASSIQMESSGRISIRNNPGSAYENFAAGIGTATDWIATSDCRLKKNIVPIENALSKTLGLNGVCYHRHDDCTDSVHMGFIAQEVEKIIPELVTREKATDIDAQYGITDEKLGLKYEKLTAILVEAIKEQQKQIEELKLEIININNNLNLKQ